MPIYEYRCDECARGFEVLTAFAERDRAQPCPACESRQTRIRVSTFAFAGIADGVSGAVPRPAGGGCCGGTCGCGS